MRLRTKIFTWTGFFLILILGLLFFLTNFLAEKNIESAHRQGIHQLVLLEKRSEKNVADYVSVQLYRLAGHMEALFDQIRDQDWWLDRFIPTKLSYDTSLWSDSSIVLENFPWIDLVQTKINDKLTSLIIAQPPYTQNILRVIINPVVSCFITQNENHELDVYIGVPYWSNKEIQRLKIDTPHPLFYWSRDKDYWLLFSPEHLLGAHDEKLIIREILIPTTPLEPITAINSNTVFQDLEKELIGVIQLIRNAFSGEKELIQTLQNPETKKAWIAENLRLHSTLSAHDNIGANCLSYLCNSNEDTSLYQERAGAGEINIWQRRRLSIEFQWELGYTVTTGIWNFNPLSPDAPQGLAYFNVASESQLKNKTSFMGVGTMASHTFFSRPITTHTSCQIKPLKTGVNSCSGAQIEIHGMEGLNGLYATKTMLLDYEDTATGFKGNIEMTVGSNISLMFQELALGIGKGLFLIDESGYSFIVASNGELLSKDSFDPASFQAVKSGKSLLLQKRLPGGYNLVEINTFNGGRTRLYLMSPGSNLFAILQDFDLRIHALLARGSVRLALLISTIFIIAMIVLDSIMRHIIKPLFALVRATKSVSRGKWDEIALPTNRYGSLEVKELCTGFSSMVEEMKNSEKVHAILNKIIPQKVADTILRDGVKVGGELKNVSILFADIRGFTHLAEKMEPHHLLSLLNQVLSLLSDVVDRHEGIIDKYMGDEIMALFGAPVGCDNPGRKGMECALEMLSRLKEWNDDRRRRGECTLEIGIGIQVGQVVAGNIGSEKRLNYTVLGNNVNLASRLCREAGPMEILLVDPMVEACKELGLPLESKGSVSLKGFSGPIEIFLFREHES